MIVSFVIEPDRDVIAFYEDGRRQRFGASSAGHQEFLKMLVGAPLERDLPLEFSCVRVPSAAPESEAVED